MHGAVNRIPFENACTYIGFDLDVNEEPSDDEESFENMCTVLIGRCDDVDQVTCVGPTPRESHTPYDFLKILNAWPADDSSLARI